MQKLLLLTEDVVTIDRPTLLAKAKDKPVLFSAISARVNALLTLDRIDFQVLLNTVVYGVEVCTPAGFLMSQRKQGSLRE
jgi:hypothetical protein